RYKRFSFEQRGTQQRILGQQFHAGRREKRQSAESRASIQAMATINAIQGDAFSLSGSADLILTDPPFDMSGEQLAKALSNYAADHLVLITSMRQLLSLMQRSDWQLSFDFVL